MPGNAGGEKS
jgi:hypothetical protein